MYRVMDRKTYLIDTNVLLQDPQAIERFQGNNVVLPFNVLEELDRKKKYTDNLGHNARLVLRFIDELSQKGNIYKGVDIGDGINLRVMPEIRNGQRAKLPFSYEGSKNKFICSAYVLKEAGEKAVIVSRDFVFRAKSNSLGIDAEDYSSLKEPYEALYRGIRHIELPKPQVDKFFLEGFIKVDGEFFANEYLVISSEGNTQITVKYNFEKKRFEPLIPIEKGIWGIKPLNEEQQCGIDLLLRDDIDLVTFIGQAGTGKTLLALTVGLKKVFDDDDFKRILVSRPIMPLGKDIGFLPGTKEEKIYHWMQPIYDNLEYLCEYTTDGVENGSETKKWIMDSEKIEMEAVTYIRGRSLTRTWIIIDEAQNLTPHEAKTIISRAGKGTKVIMTGDPTQIDNPYLDKDSNALTYIVERMKHCPIYGHITFSKTERSKLSALAAELL